MNEQSIKLSGKFNISEPLEIDRSYEITLTGGVTSIAKHSNENGTFEYTHTVKPEFGEIVGDKGKTLKLRKKGSQSQVWRREVESRGEDYVQIMTIVLSHPEEVLDFLKKLN